MLSSTGHILPTWELPHLHGQTGGLTGAFENKNKKLISLYLKTTFPPPTPNQNRLRMTTVTTQHLLGQVLSHKLMHQNPVAILYAYV